MTFIYCEETYTFLQTYVKGLTFLQGEICLQKNSTSKNTPSKRGLHMHPLQQAKSRNTSCYKQKPGLQLGIKKIGKIAISIIGYPRSHRADI